MKILFVSSYALFPDTRFGGSKRLYFLCREWSKRHEVDLIHLDGCRECQEAEPRGAPGARTLFLNDVFPEAGLSRLWKAPMDVGRALRRRRDSVDGFLENREYDGVFLAYPWALSVIDALPEERCPRTAYLEDDLALPDLAARGRASRGLESWLRKFRWIRAKAHYSRHAPRLSRVVAISRQEAGILSESFGGVPVSTFGYGVELESLPLLPLPDRRLRAGFIGNYGHPPNRDAAVWLVEEILPALRARHPEAELVLAGPGLPESLAERWRGAPGLRLLGPVTDLADFYGQIGVFLNAVRTGRGLRTKVVEAAAYGRPVISTPLGAEGLEDLDLAMAETAETFATAFSAVAETGEGAPGEKRRQSNRRRVAERFGIESLARKLEEECFSAVGDGGGDLWPGHTERLGACIGCDSVRIREVDAPGRLWRCGDCGLVFDNPRPDTAAIVEFYSRPGQYDAWLGEDAARTRLWRRRLAKLRKNVPAGGRLLDVGAGIGQFLHEAKKRFSELDGTEVSTSAVRIARERFGIPLRQGVLEGLALPSEAYDCVTAFHVWEHVPHPGAFLAACHGLLKPGGRVVLAVPNDLESLGAWLRRLRRRLAPAPEARGLLGLPPLSLTGTMDELHLSHFTADSLRRLIRKQGFILEDLSLDPFYAARGLRLVRHTFRYLLCEAWRRLTGRNIYGTHWIVARKS